MHDDGVNNNKDEQQYLDLIQRIVTEGVLRKDRTGTGTYSIFGAQMRFSLRDHTLPLLTTKRVFWRGVVEELLWCIRGSTDSKQLSAKGIKIWDANGSRYFLDKCGFHDREEGDLGPVYGFQWRFWGTPYVDCQTDYRKEIETGNLLKGVDQLKQCIEQIRNDPYDRRIILSAWNPSDIPQMVLPPCHCFCQFYVANGELSCQLYQRSADMGLGVPFNIASYALLTHLIANVCNLKAGELIHTMGDCHIYLNHVDALLEQVKRIPRTFPKLYLKHQHPDIDLYEYKDFEIQNYFPYESIQLNMAV